MSPSLFIAIAALILMFATSITFGLFILFHYTWEKAMTQQKEFLDSLSDDEDLDAHYEHNRQIIEPIGDNPFLR